MIDILLMEALLKAIKNGARLIIIGDSDQLPSVGAGNVLGDLIESGAFPVIRLTDIFRQSEQSLIITNAHRINAGELPDTSRNGADSDFFYLRRESEEAIAATVIDLVQNRLPRSYGADIVPKIQVLTPSRKGLSGTDILNAGLQEALNPKMPGKAEKKSRDVIFRVGDRVMQTKNNYEIEWETDDGKTGVGVYNGDIGRITDVRTGQVTITYDDGKQVNYENSQLEEVDHAFAITVHKSQGSEFDTVVMPVFRGVDKLFTRNLLYTAITRAKNRVVLVGQKAALAKMVDNDYEAKRFSYLKYEAIALNPSSGCIGNKLNTNSRIFIDTINVNKYAKIL
jgi:exodeoxyribonuclease V alpha subunit